MKLLSLMCVFALSACVSTPPEDQTSLTWAHEPTIADYRNRAENAPDPIVKAIWMQLINTHHWCNDVSQTATHQARCQVEIDLLRSRIIDLRLVSETLCGAFVESNKCAEEVAQVLHVSSRESINASEKLSIAQDQ